MVPLRVTLEPDRGQKQVFSLAVANDQIGSQRRASPRVHARLDAVRRVARDGEKSPFHRMCISMITHPDSDADTRTVLRAWTDRIAPETIPVSILSNPTTMSRAAGMVLTKSLSKEFASDNILVNTVCIGLIKSGQHERRAKAAGKDGERLVVEQEGEGSTLPAIVHPAARG